MSPRVARRPRRTRLAGRRSSRRKPALTRLLLYPLWGAVLLLVACGRPVSVGPTSSSITIDTLRADRLGCYGGRHDLGRAMCSVADPGTRFTWAFATAPLTVPSVASILTSTYPSEHGFSQWSTDPLTEGPGDAGRGTRRVWLPHGRLRLQPSAAARPGRGAWLRPVRRPACRAGNAAGRTTRRG